MRGVRQAAGTFASLLQWAVVPLGPRNESLRRLLLLQAAASPDLRQPISLPRQPLESPHPAPTLLSISGSSPVPSTRVHASWPSLCLSLLHTHCLICDNGSISNSRKTTELYENKKPEQQHQECDKRTRRMEKIFANCTWEASPAVPLTSA